MEPLAASIQQIPNVCGIETQSYHPKICLYADDIFLYITKPSNSSKKSII